MLAKKKKTCNINVCAVNCIANYSILRGLSYYSWGNFYERSSFDTKPEFLLRLDMLLPTLESFIPKLDLLSRKGAADVAHVEIFMKRRFLIIKQELL